MLVLLAWHSVHTFFYLALQEEALPVGGIDGAWNGRVLFNCKPKHGLLVPISTIIPDSQPKQVDTSGTLS